eukprot:Protomagalhaensia_wolfi_Nauph_80__801@NODE_1463_length_1516_cov_42_033852_g1069_i1_p1_GENE_NODE_1463_length_1516_cov_42_033852_g1069_i1NODE_1463_length_1516_cov_42_033852_g1069_i1_p1_ORF_typecomplete_len351_score56_56AMPK1_CBM/PF16561_5/2_3e26AMPK1_CBM/PF16561_5/1_8e03AMPKBI/PF04739_15/0_00045CBM_48/PF02922_18/0_0018CBM_48/PF02922_18/6_3e03CBM53/PF16760_5/0_23CBM53/PF16760_5/2_2e03_NODE_1463_length_1516_cov_42_033852_g1069_i1631115
MGSQVSYQHETSSGIPGLVASGGARLNTMSLSAMDPKPCNSQQASQPNTSPAHAGMTPLEKARGVGPALAVPAKASKGGNGPIDDAVGDTVTCVFTWAHGGHTVYLTGSFNDWSVEGRIPLVKAGHEFVTVQDLPKGRHTYKFIVDDVWKFAPDQQTVTDENGFVNNVLDITNHKRFEYQINSELSQARRVKYHQYVPDPSEYTSDAPQIPLLFSKTSCPASDPPPRMPAPLHSVANHLYHDTTASNVFGPHVTVVATTHRWRGEEYMNVNYQKHCTTILVTLNPLFPLTTQAFTEYRPTDPLRELITRHFLSAERSECTKPTRASSSPKESSSLGFSLEPERQTDEFNV